MKLQDKSVLIVFLVIILGLAVFLFFQAQPDQNLNTEPPNGQEESPNGQEGSPGTSGTIPAEEGYPNNVLDGGIVEIDLESETPVIKISARVFKIVLDAGEMVKIIEISPDTEFLSYNMETKEEGELKLEDFKVGDEITAAVNESTFEEVLTRETFTAFRITRLYTPVSQENL